MTFIENFEKLHEHIKGYTYFGFSIRRGRGKDSEVIGWNCSSSSIVRKDETLRRVNDTIENLNLPLITQENDLEKTKHFKILKKINNENLN